MNLILHKSNYFFELSRLIHYNFSKKPIRFVVSPELLILKLSNKDVSILIFNPSKFPKDEEFDELFCFIGSDINNENDA